MKIKKYILIILMFQVILATSCSRFLEETPASNETRISTIGDFQDLLMGSAMQLVHVQYFPTIALYDDDMDQAPNYPTGTTSTIATVRGYHYTWQPDMMVEANSLGDGYNLAYGRIKGCNAVLDGVDNAIRATHEQIDVIKAQALTLRAFYYFRLVNMFGKPYNYEKNAPGVVLKTTAGIAENGIARSTVAEVYEQLVKDLTMAITLFKPYGVSRGSFQCNLPTAYIILSRVYLHMEAYEKCIEAANNAIATGGQLTDFTKLSTLTLYSYSNSEVTWIYGRSETAGATNTGTAFQPSSQLVGLFASTDKRLAFWFNAAKTDQVKSITSTALPSNTIRIAEAYLNRMEAYALINNAAAAVADLNTLRRNRITGYTDVNITNPALLLENIRTERRKELCFELHRWFDLKRYGMPSIQHVFRNNTTLPWQTYTLKEKDPLYVIPIPEVYFDNNNLLEQNTSRSADIRPGI